MAKPYDATLNELIDARADDWAGFLCARTGVPVGPAEILDTDLSVTSQADKLFRVNGPRPAALHLELESTGRLGIPDELLRYNVLACGVTGLPVHSVLVLLRPKANATDQTGFLEVEGADGRPYLTFRYAVVRVWQETAAGLLAAGPGLAPLSLLTNEAAADLPSAFDRFRERLRAGGLTATVERGLIGSAFVLCGLRYGEDRIDELYRRVSMTLEDSTTYQWILRRGRAEGVAQGVAQGRTEGMAQEAQRLLLLQGHRKFKELPPGVEAAISAITDRDRLERMAGRIFDATGWDDLLATP